MTKILEERREAWITISIFIALLCGLSGLAHFAIVQLNPASIYVGALMVYAALEMGALALQLAELPDTSLICLRCLWTDLGAWIRRGAEPRNRSGMDDRAWF